MIRALAVVIAILLATPVHAESVWVFFRDRGALERPGPARDHALAAAAARVTPRALARRAKMGEGTIGDRDLEPDPAYVGAISARGGSMRTVSSWLNAVSVDAPAESLDAIASLPFVERVRAVANGSLDESAASDSLADLQDAGPSLLQLEMCHVPEVHAMGDHGEGVIIAVLDSGFQLDHESLRQLSVLGQRDFVDQDDDPSYDPRTDVRLQPQHGTAVLSVLAGYKPGTLIGPAYRAQYLLAKTERIDLEAPAEEDYWCAGIEWAEAEGADIVTSSLTYHHWYQWRDLDGRTSPSTRAANLALERGVLVINAAGNEGQRLGTVGAPADAPGAITVGAVNGIGTLSSFSSIGPTYDGRIKPDVVALGSSVYAAQALTWDRYYRTSGTSLAAPLVAGCAALVLSRHPDWSPEQVREALTMSASRAERPNNDYGWGIVNARDAVLYPLIEGTVTDSITGEPLANVTVRVAQGNKGGEVVTDSTGAYVLPNLPRGKYTLTTTKPGYADATAGPLDIPPSLGDVNVRLRYLGR